MMLTVLKIKLYKPTKASVNGIRGHKIKVNPEFSDKQFDLFKINSSYAGQPVVPTAHSPAPGQKGLDAALCVCGILLQGDG